MPRAPLRYTFSTIESPHKYTRLVPGNNQALETGFHDDLFRKGLINKEGNISRFGYVSASTSQTAMLTEDEGRSLREIIEGYEVTNSDVTAGELTQRIRNLGNANNDNPLINHNLVIVERSIDEAMTEAQELAKGWTGTLIRESIRENIRTGVENAVAKGVGRELPPLGPSYQRLTSDFTEQVSNKLTQDIAQTFVDEYFAPQNSPLSEEDRTQRAIEKTVGRWEESFTFEEGKKVNQQSQAYQALNAEIQAIAKPIVESWATDHVHVFADPNDPYNLQKAAQNASSKVESVTRSLARSTISALADPLKEGEILEAQKIHFDYSTNKIIGEERLLERRQPGVEPRPEYQVVAGLTTTNRFLTDTPSSLTTTYYSPVPTPEQEQVETETRVTQGLQDEGFYNENIANSAIYTLQRIARNPVKQLTYLVFPDLRRAAVAVGTEKSGWARNIETVTDQTKIRQLEERLVLEAAKRSIGRHWLWAVEYGYDPRSKKYKEIYASRLMDPYVFANWLQSKNGDRYLDMVNGSLVKYLTPPTPGKAAVYQLTESGKRKLGSGRDYWRLDLTRDIEEGQFLRQYRLTRNSVESFTLDEKRYKDLQKKVSRLGSKASQNDRNELTRLGDSLNRSRPGFIEKMDWLKKNHRAHQAYKNDFAEIKDLKKFGLLLKRRKDNDNPDPVGFLESFVKIAGSMLWMGVKRGGRAVYSRVDARLNISEKVAAKLLRSPRMLRILNGVTDFKVLGKLVKGAASGAGMGAAVAIFTGNPWFIVGGGVAGWLGRYGLGYGAAGYFFIGGWGWAIPLAATGRLLSFYQDFLGADDKPNKNLTMMKRWSRINLSDPKNKTFGNSLRRPFGNFMYRLGFGQLRLGRFGWGGFVRPISGTAAVTRYIHLFKVPFAAPILAAYLTGNPLWIIGAGFGQWAIQTYLPFKLESMFNSFSVSKAGFFSRLPFGLGARISGNLGTVLGRGIGALLKTGGLIGGGLGAYLGFKYGGVGGGIISTVVGAIIGTLTQAVLGKIMTPLVRFTTLWGITNPVRWLKNAFFEWPKAGQGFKAWLGKLFDTYLKIEAILGIGAGFKALFSALKAGWAKGGLWGAFKAVPGGLWGFIKNLFGMNHMASFIGNRLSLGAKGFLNTLLKPAIGKIGFWQKIWSVLKGLPINLFKGIGSFFKGFFGKFLTVPFNLLKLGLTKLPVLLGWLKGLITAGIGKLVAATQATIGATTSMASTVWSGITAFFSILQVLLGGLRSLIIAGIGKLIAATPAIIGAVTAIASAVWSGIMAAFAGLQAFAGSLAALWPIFLIVLILLIVVAVIGGAYYVSFQVRENTRTDALVVAVNPTSQSSGPALSCNANIEKNPDPNAKIDSVIFTVNITNTYVDKRVAIDVTAKTSITDGSYPEEDLTANLPQVVPGTNRVIVQGSRGQTAGGTNTLTLSHTITDLPLGRDAKFVELIDVTGLKDVDEFGHNGKADISSSGSCTIYIGRPKVDTPTGYPVRGKISQTGLRDPSEKPTPKHENGSIDIISYWESATDNLTIADSPVYSTHEGLAGWGMDSRGYRGGYGLYVWVQGKNYKTLYAHLAPGSVNLAIRRNTVYPVKSGCLLAKVDATGYSEPPGTNHLHYEIRKMVNNREVELIRNRDEAEFDSLFPGGNRRAGYIIRSNEVNNYSGDCAASGP